jgi:hypothetical protein
MPLEYRSVLAIYIMFRLGKENQKTSSHETKIPEQTHRIFQAFRGQSHAGSGRSGLCDRTSANRFLFRTTRLRSGLISADA